MEYRQLGRSGLRVSPLCLGCMGFGSRTPEDEAIRIIHAAIQEGINFLDTADCYRGERWSSEEVVGKALAEGGLRDRVVLATKVTTSMGEGPNDWGSSRAHIMAACEASLRRLCTDYIDLYQLHWMDFTTPLDETLRALDDLVRQGKVRYIGCSKFAPSRLVEALCLSDRFGWTRFVSEQPPYNLLDRRIENELVYVCLRHGVGIIPWAPLATGILSGRHRKGQAPPNGSRASHEGIGPTRLNDAALDVVEALRSLAQAKEVTMAQFSLAWIIHQPGITAPIIGCRTMDHLTSALEVLDIEWTEDDRAQVDTLIPPGSAVSDYYDSNVYQSLRAEVGLKQR